MSVVLLIGSLPLYYIFFCKIHSKPVLSGHSKIGKTKVLKTNVSVMKVESIVGAFCNTFDLH